MDRRDKIQYLLMTHLLEKGHIKLNLPDGMTLELGIVQEDKQGDLVKTDDYSWLIASQKNRTVSMDSFNFGLRYAAETDKILFEEETVDQEGMKMKVVMGV